MRGRPWTTAVTRADGKYRRRSSCVRVSIEPWYRPAADLSPARAPCSSCRDAISAPALFAALVLSSTGHAASGKIAVGMADPSAAQHVAEPRPRGHRRFGGRDPRRGRGGRGLGRRRRRGRRRARRASGITYRRAGPPEPGARLPAHRPARRLPVVPGLDPGVRVLGRVAGVRRVRVP